MLTKLFNAMPVDSPFTSPVRLIVFCSVATLVVVCILLLLKIYDTIASRRANRQIAEMLTRVRGWAIIGADHQRTAAAAAETAVATQQAVVDQVSLKAEEIKTEVPKAVVKEMEIERKKSDSLHDPM